MRILQYVISMPKTIIFNFKVFPFKVATKLPVLISNKVKISKLHKNCIHINSTVSRFMIRINFDEGSEGINCSSNGQGYFSVKEEGQIIFNGKASFASGISIRVDKGKLNIGKNFSANKNCLLSCTENITIGDDVLVGWNVNLRDADGHSIFKLDDNSITNNNNSVSIGNHVWIASNVDILKGTLIPNNCIIGYRSCLNKKFYNANCIIAGYPGKVLREGVNWIK